MLDLRRRQFVTLLGGAAVGWPLAARAQQPAVPVIGFLNGGSSWEYAQITAAFRNGLSETGYVEARNVWIEYRWAEGRYERLPALAADLVRRQVSVIAANTPATPAAKVATTTIPIIFLTSTDPVAAGLVASLNRPGGNLTGVALLNVDIGPKRLELLNELVPARVVALLSNPTNPNSERQSRIMQAAARTLGLQLHVLHASTERDFDAAFATLAQLRAGALIIGADAFFINQSEQLGALALRHAVPAISFYREFVAAGGMMSYGGDLTDAFRLMGVYGGRILKGEKPADLPVQQETKFALIINAELTAKRLGLFHELVPSAARIAVLINPADPVRAQSTLDDVTTSARTIGLQIQVFRASTIGEIEAAFATISRERLEALFVGPDPFMYARRIQLAILAARHGVATCFGARDHTEVGGLMSYGADVNEMFRLAGVYVGRILKGEKPADLPVLQPTKFELVINLATARALALDVPPMLLARADEVIE
jgi:putative ABC transport system substrate-binding protein